MEQGMDNASNNGPMGAAQAPEQMVAERVTVAEMGSAPAMPEAPKKKSNGMLIGFILCIVLAIGGIGFGVWMMMDGNTQKDSLNKQISDLRKQNNDLLEQVGDNSTTINIDTDDGDVDTADYIYVGEWGVKIKIPEGLNRVSYEFYQHGGTTQIEGTTVSVYGTVGEGLPDFANPYKNNDALGSIGRIPKDTYSGSEYDGVEADRRACGVDSGLVFSDDIYNYCYSHPQAVYSTDESEQDLEVESTNVIQEMLQNKDNYLKI